MARRFGAPNGMAVPDGAARARASSVPAGPSPSSTPSISSGCSSFGSLASSSSSRPSMGSSGCGASSSSSSRSSTNSSSIARRGPTQPLSRARSRSQTPMGEPTCSTLPKPLDACDRRQHSHSVVACFLSSQGTVAPSLSLTCTATTRPPGSHRAPELRTSRASDPQSAHTPSVQQAGAHRGGRCSHPPSTSVSHTHSLTTSVAQRAVAAPST